MDCDSSLQSAEKCLREGSVLKVYANMNQVKEECEATGHRLVVYQNGVYDVSEFLEKVRHPGGNNLIEENIGTDITEKMQLVSHSINAYRILAKYKIGILNRTAKGQRADEPHLHKPSQTTLDNINNKINLKQPVLHQIYKADFTLEEYITFIHDPKLLNDPPRNLRIFKSNFLEFFSMTPWYFILYFWLPVMSSFGVMGYMNMDSKSLIITGLTFAAGIFSWTIIEYILHRWVFHFDYHLPSANWIFATHFLIHGIHHAFPQDQFRLVFPLAFGIVVASLVCLLYTALWGTVYGFIAFSGFGYSYILYEMMHYSFHHFDFDYAFFKKLKAYHSKHHYKNHTTGFGVTNQFWDFVCGTYAYD
jgi:4-hydroxysphinganine ceramide fatty acyl 2-hydroxylase